VAEPIGEQLRQARMARRLTLVEASDATKIRVRYLRALEAEDWDAMPAPAYARGFLRTYATYLEIDADALVEDYRRGVEPPTVQARPSEHPPPATPGTGRRRLVGWPAVAIAAAAVIAIVVFILGVTGGGNNGGKKGQDVSAKAGHHRHHHRSHHGGSKPAPTPTPTEASIELRPTGTVWVCLVDQSGKALVNGETLNAGDSRGPFHSSAFEVNLGNGAVQIRADGRDVGVPDSPSPLGYRVGPEGVRSLAPTSRPTCA
jgi:cytoskeletal protein RodZ